jgi:hypothetical protein
MVKRREKYMRIFILESPNPLDILEGRAEGPSLKKLCRLIGHESEVFTLLSRYDLSRVMKFISTIHGKCNKECCDPDPDICIHISAHGDENGLQIGGNSVEWKKLLRYIRPILENSYLFSWDGVPGKNNEELIGYLKGKFNIDWIKTAKIKKIDDGKTIKISTERNYLLLTLSDETNKVKLEIDDGRTDEFSVKHENSELKIYDLSYTGNRILVLSACLAENQKITKYIEKELKKDPSLLPPIYVFTTIGKVPWDSAAVGWAIFYHLLPKANLDDRETIKEILRKITEINEGKIKYFRWSKLKNKYLGYKPKVNK